MRHRSNSMLFRVSVCLSCAALLTAIAMPAWAQLLTSSDLSRLRSVGSAAISPDGHYIAYSITMRDLPGRPYGQLWVMDLSTAKSVRLGGEKPASADLASDLGLPKTGCDGIVDQEVFESIYNPGKLLLLVSWKDAAPVGRWKPKAVAAGELRHRRVRIIRDYGMTDRREAPQYYPPVQAADR